MSESSLEVIDLGSGLGYTQPAPPEVKLFDVTERTELAVATYDALGLVVDSGKASEVIGQQMEALHQALVSDADPELIVQGVETFKPVDFTGKFTLNALVAAYDQMQLKDGSTPPETSVWGELWDQYNIDELNKRSVDGLELPAAVQARAMLMGGDLAGGLYFTKLSLEEQLGQVDLFSANYRGASHPNTTAGVMNTADLIVVNAQHQVEGDAGRPLLDNENDNTFARIPQLGTKRVDGVSLVGGVYSNLGQLRLARSRGLAGPDRGVRLSVGPTKA